MEIHIRLAGVQLGPYSLAQVREYLAEGLLSPGDAARREGTLEWKPVNDLLAETPPDDKTPEPAGDVPEAPKRAPTAPPGVTHLPSRLQETVKEPLVRALARKTDPLGPTAPSGPSPSGGTAFSTLMTSPLVPAQHVTKKVARDSLIKERGSRTAPLPSRGSAPPAGTPASAAATTAQPPPSTPVGARKKTQQEPLDRELTAKTVPMRSSPSAAPPLPSTLPITAPLPTKQGFRPASGTVPPPSVVNALTKKLGQVVQPDPVQTTPPTLGLTQDIGKMEAPKPGAAAKLAEDTSDASAVKSSPRRESKWLLSALIYLCAALALITLYYVWSPYHAASALRNALNDGNAAGLNASVDFAAVRASLKGQIQAQLTGRARR